jgi:hypothetical protein
LPPARRDPQPVDCRAARVAGDLRARVADAAAEILGEDDRAVAQGNTVLEGTRQLTGLVGPAIAGVLIGVLGAANVLWLDAGSFLASFLVLAALVPARPLSYAAAGPLLVHAGLRQTFLVVAAGMSLAAAVFAVGTLAAGAGG